MRLDRREEHGHRLLRGPLLRREEAADARGEIPARGEAVDGVGGHTDDGAGVEGAAAAPGSPPRPDPREPASAPPAASPPPCGPCATGPCAPTPGRTRLPRARSETASAWSSPTSSSSVPPGPRARAASGHQTPVDVESVGAAVESGDRLEQPDIGSETGDVARAHVRRVADDQCERPRRGCRPAGPPCRSTTRSASPSDPAFAPATASASRLSSMASTRTPASCARLRAMAPLPVPTSAMTGVCGAARRALRLGAGRAQGGRRPQACRGANPRALPSPAGG